MPSFGSYEARREVAGTGFCARWEAALPATISSTSLKAAKPFGDRFLATAVGPSVVVPWLPRAGLDEEARRLVGAARDQAQLVGAGAKRWSIIADFGLMDDGRGAFVVRPSLAWTVERLVLAQYVLTSVELRGIVLGVLDGLIELERNSARQWGNLSSSTVMLAAGPGDARLADGSAVVLTELESRERLGTDAHVADLRAVGRLIYEMVLHKRPPLKAVSGWSATWNDGWETVGDGRWWFDLANRLMAAGTAVADAGAVPTLAQIRQQVLEHRPHKPFPKRQAMFAGGIVAVVLVAGAGYLMLRTPVREAVVLSADQLEERARLAKWQAFVERWRLWFGDLHAARGQISALAAGAPPTSTIRELSNLLNDPAVRDPREVAGAGSGASLLDLRDNPGDAIQGEKIIAGDASLSRIDKARDQLLGWTELARLREIAGAWESRGWGKATPPLLNAAGGVTAALPVVIVKEANTEAPPVERSGDIVPAVLAAQSAIENAARIDGIWDAITKIVESEKASGDPVLSKLDLIARAETDKALAAAAAGEPALQALRTSLERVDGAASAAMAFEKGEIAGWDRAGFRESARLKEIASGQAGLAQLVAWREEAARPDFAAVDAPDPRVPVLEKAAKTTETLKPFGERLQGLEKTGRELTLLPAEFDQRLAQIGKDVQTLKGTAWSNRNRTAAEDLSRKLDQEIDSLERDSADAFTTAMLTLGEAIARQDPGQFSSKALTGAWEQALSAARSASTKREAFGKLRGVRETLHALDLQLPEKVPCPIQGGNAESWKIAVSQARDAIFARALSTGTPDIAGAGAQYQLWLSRSTQTLKDLSQAGQLLFRGQEFQGAEKDSHLAELVRRVESDPDIAVLGPVLPDGWGAIREIRAIGASADAAQIARWLAPGSPAPVALAAWTRLGELGWPSDNVSFTQASQAISRTLPAIIDIAIPPEARESVTESVRRRAARMWVAYMNQRPGSDRAGIERGLTDAGLFGVTPSEADGLAPSARYNALVWELGNQARDFLTKETQRGVGAGSDAAALSAQTRFASDLLRRLQEGSASLGLGGNSAVSNLQKALSGIAEREARPAFDPLKNGPASIVLDKKQVWKASREGDRYIYSLDLPPGRMAPGQPPVKLEFRPVKIMGSGGPIATYVSTHEVSVGMVMGAVEVYRSSSLWEQLRLTLRWWDDGPDPRYGPATWTWDSRRKLVLMNISSRNQSSGWMQVLEDLHDKPYYAPALGTIAPPAYDSPMDWISPDAALLLSRLMGARLPTVEEWRAAVDDAGGLEKVSDKSNRRDKNWTMQFDYVKDLDIPTKEWPHAGIFWPRGLKPAEKQPDGKLLYVNAADDSALTYNDGYLWFAPVLRDSQGWSHLVGNVSEIVLEGNPDAIASLEPNVEAVTAAIDNPELKWRVIGGSALSAITLRDSKPYEVDEPYANPSIREARKGYSDVGFRLAFSEGGNGRPKEPPAVLTARALEQAVFLGPAADHK
ncbi:MAG: hypothetical protein U0573_04700 [Phycisphaerales bacterium]|nr:hypothetical protein [Planctomycetota bacterium]